MLTPPKCLGDVTNAVLRVLLGTRNFVTGAIAIGTNKAKVKTATAVQYCINGVLYTKAATDDLFVFTDVKVQPVLTTCYYLLCLDASGNSVVVNGVPMLTASITTTHYPVPPDIPVDANGIPTACPIGIVKIALASTATFTPGTTLLDAANLTATYFNVSCMPVNGGAL